MTSGDGPADLVRDVLERDLCIGCGACVDLCPYFKNYRGRTVQLFPCTLESGRCFAYCPKVEVDLDHLTRGIHGRAYDGSPLGHHIEVLASRAGPKAPPGRFQGGGTATALVASALRRGAIDSVALTDRDGLLPVARVITRWQDVAACGTSKLTAAPTLSALNAAVREGFRRIGVVGTPCQLTAVAGMRLHSARKAQPVPPVELAIGLFCNWAIDPRRLTALMIDRLDPAGIRRMDIPPPPAGIMVFETDRGRREVPLSDIKPLIPPTCFVCPDMTAELADVSIGMLEGRFGWNTLIVRSEAGDEALRAARREGFVETEAYPPERLRHLTKAADEKKRRSMRMLRRRGLINDEGGERHPVLRVPEAVVVKILAD
jgi:coenzyme F420 hydrogenase subunit beta